MKKRIEWIDSLKGWGIILVVLGHAGVPLDINKYILSFHMPLFFIISGMLYNKEKYDLYSIKEFANKKFKELIVPYIWFSLLGVIISVIFNLIIGKPINIIMSLLSIVMVLNIKNRNMIELVLWFLPCIFVVEILFFYICKKEFLFKRLKYVLLIFFIGAFVESSLIKHIIPFTLDIALTGIVYFGIGFLMKKRIIDYVDNIEKNRALSISSLLICGIISVLCVTFNPDILYMYVNKYGNYFLSFIGALSGSIFLLNLSIQIPRVNFVNFLGQNTMLIFLLHFKVTFITNRVFSVLGNKFNNVFFIKLLLASINTFLILILLYPIIKLINSKFKFLIGKKETIISQRIIV